jgi:hypothetical protein
MKFALRYLLIQIVAIFLTNPALAVDNQLPDEEALQSVWIYIQHKDCVGAVKNLNEGISRGKRDLMLLAGSMYEDGVCVKQNWDSAAKMYIRAHRAGHRKAISRLVSGYASPLAGPDRAAALWWAAQGNLNLPKECKSAYLEKDNPERFVELLKQMTISELDACVYVAGVMSSIRGELEFPKSAVLHGVGGTVEVTFVPSEPRVDVVTLELDSIQLRGFISGDALLDKQSKMVKNALENEVKTIAARTLKRYPKPERIDTFLSLKQEFTFKFADE